MNAIQALKTLGPIDGKNVRRDSLLRWMVFLPLFVGVVVRLGAPILTPRVIAQFQFDPTPYYDLLLAMLLMMTPVIFGSVVGFLLLDQRDDQTLVALQVTPLSLNGYLAYRIAVPIVFCVLITMIVIPLTGLVPVNLFSLFLVALAAAPLAPILALFFAAFAQNKVQGFALMKGMGVLMLPPVIAYFVHADWQLVFGLAPTYWPAKLLWSLQAGEPNAWIYFVVGLVYQAVLLIDMLGHFNKAMHR